jgi:hypothetical protein
MNAWGMAVQYLYHDLDGETRLLDLSKDLELNKFKSEGHMYATNECAKCALLSTHLCHKKIISLSTLTRHL